MKKKSAILVFIGLLSVCSLWGQSDINYQHKALLRTLEKAGITNWELLSEMELPAELANDYPVNGKFFRIADSSTDEYQFIYIGRVNSCRAGGCATPGNADLEGDSEYFDYYILFDRDKTVRKVQVFNYQATHGQEITARGWLKQFVGHDGSEQLQVNKNVDAISGATISVYAITQDVELKTEILKQIG